MADAVVPGGKLRSGLDYFHRPAESDWGTMTMPVIDFDDVRRYSVSLAMPKR